MITFVCNMEQIYNKFGEVTQTVWTLHNWNCYEDWEAKKPPIEEIYVYNGDIRKTYDTDEGEEDFYVGLEKSDFSCEYAKDTIFTPQGIAEYAKNNAVFREK